MKQMLQQAEAVLGYDILQLCLSGPKEQLDDTKYSQPALFIANLAAVEKLRHEDPDAVSSCTATAGGHHPQQYTGSHVSPQRSSHKLVNCQFCYCSNAG